MPTCSDSSAEAEVDVDEEEDFGSDSDMHIATANSVHNSTEKLTALPGNALDTIVTSLGIPALRALRITCAAMRAAVDLHVKIINVGADPQAAKTDHSWDRPLKLEAGEQLLARFPRAQCLRLQIGLAAACRHRRRGDYGS